MPCTSYPVVCYVMDKFLKTGGGSTVIEALEYVHDFGL